MRKYGFDSFEFEVLERCDIESLSDREKFYINKFNTTDKKHGYNLTLGGEGGDTFSCRDLESQEKTRIKLKNCGACGICKQMEKGKHVTDINPHIKNKWETNFKLSMLKLSERRRAGKFTTAELDSYKRMSEQRKGLNNPMFVGVCCVFNEKGELMFSFFLRY